MKIQDDELFHSKAMSLASIKKPKATPQSSCKLADSLKK